MKKDYIRNLEKVTKANNELSALISEIEVKRKKGNDFNVRQAFKKVKGIIV